MMAELDIWWNNLRQRKVTKTTYYRVQKHFPSPSVSAVTCSAFVTSQSTYKFVLYVYYSIILFQDPILEVLRWWTTTFWNQMHFTVVHTKCNNPTVIFFAPALCLFFLCYFFFVKLLLWWYVSQSVIFVTMFHQDSNFS